MLKLLIPLFTFLGFLSADAEIIVSELVCEYHHNPVGIDVQTPRLSWKILSDQWDVVQVAYEIRIAETADELLKRGKVKWSSGKVVSGESVNVPFTGPVLESRQRIYWQVRIWDGQENVTPWSEVVFWEMGMLDRDLWKASWITMPGDLQGAKSLPSQYYRTQFSVSKKVRSARIYATSLGIYQLYLNGKKSVINYSLPDLPVIKSDCNIKPMMSLT